MMAHPRSEARRTATGGRHFPAGGPLKRHVNKAPKGTARINLSPVHPAYRNAHSIFPNRVIHPKDSPRLLVSGDNQRKIGKRITKGRWGGVPIYTLTLEERATCPRSCGEWATCYGNNMHMARRHIAGLALEAMLIGELVTLAGKHPEGFAVRLHVLGDFYSKTYADLWRLALEEIPGLHVFGFTAHSPDSEIGRWIGAMNTAFPRRCRIRFSGTANGGEGALVISSLAESKHVVCPVQTGKTDCCGTCGLCWTMDKTVEFIRH